MGERGIIMLSELTPVATLAIADLNRARKYYEDTLGLTERPETAASGLSGGAAFRCGDGTIFVYESRYAGTNKATAVSFTTTDEDFDREVGFLRSKGIEFMTFELEGIKWEGDVARMGEWRAVWFADPDGNILNIGTMS
jgi:catechol 2,3-dioxygenase-like lactoylglutathione lyase family enzyme